MTQSNRKALTLTGVTILGAIAIATELHRHFLAAVWPFIDSFWFTYIAF